MTQTISRGIRLAITETLAKYGIDNVILDMELTRVITDIVQEKKEKRTTEQIKQATEDALFNSFANTSVNYAHYPERIVPVVERMHKLWNLIPPPRNDRKNYPDWLNSCDELLNACGEFGVVVLDKLHEDWESYKQCNNKEIPFAVGDPRGLVKTVRAKAALMRGGSDASLWKTNGKQTQNRLGV